MPHGVERENMRVRNGKGDTHGQRMGMVNEEWVWSCAMIAAYMGRK